MFGRKHKMRLAIATLVLLNLLLFLWNYTFPYIDPLSERYTPPPSLTQLSLVPDEGAAKPAAEADEPAPKAAPAPAKTASAPPAKPVAGSGEGDKDAKAPPGSVYVCGSIGPMLSAEEQTSVLSMLSLEARITLTPRVDENKRDLSYWVMIPPLESLSQARSQMRALSQNALNESFIVTDESHRNAISLGVFRSKEKARGLLSRVNDIGLESEARIVERGSHDYWVDFKSEQSREYYRAVAKLLQRKKNLRHTEGDCPD